MQEERPVGIQLRVVDNQIQRRVAYTIRQLGVDDITGSNGWILGFLRRNEGTPVFQKDVETEFQIARSTVTAVIKLMERKGFVRRESVAYDARLKRLQLTEKGYQMQEQLGSAIMGVEQELIAGIDEEDLKVFRNVLAQISDNAGMQIE